VKTERRLGPAGKFAHAWIDSKLTPLVIVASLLLGAFAVWKLPREEEPQIVVPMVDVFVQMPGASAREIEERVTKPMEKLLWEIPGWNTSTRLPVQVRPRRSYAFWWDRTKRRALSG
jgi:Cu/Ag efflux pump CusA